MLFPSTDLSLFYFLVSSAMARGESGRTAYVLMCHLPMVAPPPFFSPDLYRQQPSEHVHSDVLQEPQLTVSEINTSPPPDVCARVRMHTRVCVCVFLV